MKTTDDQNKKIRIFIADSTPETRDTIKKLLLFEADFEVVGTSDNGNDVVDRVKEIKPDILLMDTNLPDIDGLEASGLITKAVPTVGVILMSVSSDPDLMQKAMLAGARFFLSKPVSMDQLYATIRRVYQQYSSIRSQMANLQQSNLDIAMVAKAGAPRRRQETKVSNLIETQFSLYSSPEIVADKRSHLYMYAHSAEHLDTIQKDIKKFAEEVGGEVPDARKAKQSPSIAVGTEITVVPECEKVDFEPAFLTKKWHGDWTRFEFDFRPSDELIDEMLFIRVSIRVKGLEIAHIKTSSVVIGAKHDDSITADATVSELSTPSDNPLVNAIQRGDLSAVTATPYRKMFISYSRRDQEIALRRAKEVEQILGAEVFLDVKSLRAGDDWKYQIAKAIEDADVFHLLWSEYSANSEYCCYEWEYALQQKCPENMCVGVIRPVYWEKPAPDPPGELAHLHFEYIEMQEDNSDPNLSNHNTNYGTLRAGNVIAVYSPVGGAGTTTIAISLASGLMKEGIRVLLVDADVEYGDIAVSLNVRASHTLSDLIEFDDIPEFELIDASIVTHASGLQILCAPIRMDQGLSLRDQHPDKVAAIINQVASYYDFVVVDCGRSINNLTAPLFDLAAKIVLITVQTLTAVKNVRMVLEYFDEVDYSPDKATLVINKVIEKLDQSNKGIISPERIQSYLKRPVEGLIPVVDESFMQTAVTRGIPAIVLDRDMNKPPMKQLQALAIHIYSQMMGEDEYYEEDEVLEKKSWSLFGRVPSRSVNRPNKLIETQFSLYSSPQILADTRSYLYIYAHNAESLDAIQKDIEKFAEELGGDVPNARKAKQSPSIAVGTEITVVPECDEVDFEPSTFTKKWHGDWTRFEFEFRPTQELVDEILFIRVSIRIKDLEIAHIKTSCVVIEVEEEDDMVADAIMAEPPIPSDNPLLSAMKRGDLSAVTAKPYNKMFISYSRRDQEIALKRANEVEQILGADVFLDVKSLRAGDDWQYQLAKAIEEADVFHLLWSENSASSEYCRYEWEYALKKKCPENMCVGVIRPVYWQKPVPNPPDELAHLHFEYIEIEDRKPPSAKNIFGRR